MHRPIPAAAARLAAAVTAAAAVVVALPAAAADAPAGAAADAPALPHETFTLDNGLTVYVLEDHTIPQVASVLWFEVGSKDEPKGRTGFAHLFEHLMFKGSAHIPDGKLDLILEEGGGWSNAFTSSDMTVYFNTAASNFLETILWIEGDRMAGLLDTFDQAKLDNQRDVVRNERRQSYENQPYGMAEVRIRENLWPEGHGYHWPVIGYHEDLQAASTEDVAEFFRTYYVPANAVLVLAGDVDPAEARKLAERYLGWIPSGGTPDRPTYAEPKPLEGPVMLTETDQVQVPKLFLVWRGPKAYSKDEASLDLAARILGQGKSSRLYRRLVFQERLAQEVSASFQGEVLGGQFSVEVLAKPGVDPAKLRAAVLEEIAKLSTTPPTPAELERAKSAHESDFLSELQPVLWRGIQLAAYSVLADDADYLGKDLARFRNATAEQVTQAAAEWLPADRRVDLVIGPEPATASEPEAAAAPEAASTAPATPASEENE